MRKVMVVMGLVALLAGPTMAGVFVFDNGPPDGRIATASRPGPMSGANQETESADDFNLGAKTTLTSASFTGLLPAGVNPSIDISQVVVELYRVFPKDSDTSRPINVPTRVNSPSDVAFDSRDSTAAGRLTFTTTLLSPLFSAGNSVDLGIHPSPNQTTGGDGAVSGQEVRFDVTFTTPFDLPPDHFFFVPQVLLSNPDDHFLWLSSARLGKPGDLQSWIRNAELDPDWLRIGSDVVGGTTFNASFSLRGTAVPEPSTILMLMTGSTAALIVVRLRRVATRA